MTAADYSPILADGQTTARTSEQQIAADAAAARAYLARHGAMDLADMLGIAEVA